MRKPKRDKGGNAHVATEKRKSGLTKKISSLSANNCPDGNGVLRQR